MKNVISKIFALDEYKFAVVDNKGQHGYSLKRANIENLDSIVNYLDRYMRKNGVLLARRKIEKDVRFWMKFGNVYYIEDRDEIFMVVAFTIKRMPDITENHGIEKTLSMYMFPYECDENTMLIARKMVTEFVGAIIVEQHIPFVPTIVKLLPNDKMTPFLIKAISKKENPWIGPNGYYEIPIDMMAGDVPDVSVLSNVDINRVISYFKLFDGIERELVGDLKSGSPDYVDTIVYDILSCNDIEKYGFFNENDRLKEKNDALVQMFSKKEKLKELNIENVYRMPENGETVLFKTKDGTTVRITM